jgi:mannosyl-oligosaccharide alpha-1,2-mannosidase
LPLTDVVFNTEAHPFPRFSLGKLFKTGWQRKKSGGSPKPKADSTHASPPGIQTVRVTKIIEQEVAVETKVRGVDDVKSPAG